MITPAGLKGKESGENLDDEQIGVRDPTFYLWIGSWIIHFHVRPSSSALLSAVKDFLYL